LVGASQFALGSDAGGTDIVTLYNANGTVASTITPFPGFTGGIRTATGDVNGDGIPDIAVGTGPGTTAIVEVIDGASGDVMKSFEPFANFTGGVFVSLGDMTDDGKDELVVTPDEGGGPRVEIYQGGTLNLMRNFFGLDDPNFRGGARSAVGDINGDGYADLVISAGFGGGPRISVIDGKQLTENPNVFGFLTADFYAFDPSLRNGVYGGGPRVLILSGETLITQGSNVAIKSPIANIFGGDATSRNGVDVSARNLDDDAFSDVIVGDASAATAYQGKALAQGFAEPLYQIQEDTGPTGGVFVG
jgi:hypothetical protein